MDVQRRHSLPFAPFFFFLLTAIIFTTSAADLLPAGKNRCYSCASDNMKQNFLTRRRGPSGRVREPRLYDSMCDLDTWLIREKSAIECQGACFKWQQVLNNSGVLSYATIRGCYERMFNNASTGGAPTPSPPAGGPSASAYTTECKHVRHPLECVDEFSDMDESTCWCFGDFCNSTIIGGGMNSALLFICTFFALFARLLLSIWR